jgi:hypothetical protein
MVTTISASHYDRAWLRCYIGVLEGRSSLRGCQERGGATIFVNPGGEIASLRSQ